MKNFLRRSNASGCCFSSLIDSHNASGSICRRAVARRCHGCHGLSHREGAPGGGQAVG